MKTLDAGTLAHISAESTTLAVCWLIRRRDGVVLGFTSNAEDLEADIDGGGAVSYKAATGISVSNLETSTGKGIDNLTGYGILNSTDISEADLLKGFYDDAEMTLAVVNYADTSQFVVLVTGYIGEVKVGRRSFEAEVRSLLVRASQNVGKVCSPLCRVRNLGDSECTVNLASFTFSGQSVASVVSRSQFRTASAGVVGKPAFYFAYGTLLWTSGANAGKSVEVRSHDTGSPCLITLAEPMPFDIAPLDLFTIVAGCDRLLETCRDKFGNVLNFRGEPYVPGVDAVLRVISG